MATTVSMHFCAQMDQQEQNGAGSGLDQQEQNGAGSGLDQQEQNGAGSGLDQQKQAAAVSHGVTVEPSKHICHLCGDGFKWKSDLMMHVYLHSRKKPTPDYSKPYVPRILPKLYECQDCGYVFCLRSKFDKHVELGICKKKVESEKLCEVCGHMAKSQYHLDVHLYGHSRVKNHKCETCGEKFITHGKLVVHRAVHTGEMLHECQRCGKKFRFQQGLTRHMQGHLNGGNSECKVCGKIYPVKNNAYYSHIKSHTVEYSCEECGKTYKMKQSFTNHLKQHADLREFKCKVCGKRFNTSLDLCHHKKTHC